MWQVFFIRALLCHILQVLGAGFRSWLPDWQGWSPSLWEPCSYIPNCRAHFLSGTWHKLNSLIVLIGFKKRVSRSSIQRVLHGQNVFALLGCLLSAVCLQAHSLKMWCSQLVLDSYCIECGKLQVPRKFTSKVEGKMGYEDFVWFILSEEDKSSEPSLEYW